jgi:hypothetical protein
MMRDFSIHSRPKTRSVRSKDATTESGEAASADTSPDIQSRSIFSKLQFIDIVTSRVFTQVKVVPKKK